MIFNEVVAVSFLLTNFVQLLCFPCYLDRVSFFFIGFSGMVITSLSLIGLGFAIFLLGKRSFV